MTKQYRVPFTIAILLCGLLLSACGGEEAATPVPFARFDAQQVFDALTAAGLTIQNPVSNTNAGRGAPLTFNQRYVFEIPRIAPQGGQVVIFRTTEDLKAWEDWIATLRNNPDTRRDVVYVYTNGNALLQLNANLTNQEASAFRQVFLGLE